MTGATWEQRCPIVGMVHLLPLPGSPAYRGSVDEVVEQAATDAAYLTAGGLDGVLVENYTGPETGQA